MLSCQRVRPCSLQEKLVISRAPKEPYALVRYHTPLQSLVHISIFPMSCKHHRALFLPYLFSNPIAQNIILLTWNISASECLLFSKLHLSFNKHLVYKVSPSRYHSLLRIVAFISLLLSKLYKEVPLMAKL